MKIAELMIGDWVTNNPLDEESFNTQWERTDFAQGDYEGQFTSIQLTEEMLLKNGFIYCGIDHVYFEKNNVMIFCGTHILFSFYDDKTEEFIIHHFPIRYVHELQHLLRMCGLNDIADNFKIE